MKQICFAPTPPARQGLVEVPKHKIYPISTPCMGGGIPSPTFTPATVMSEITSQQPLPMQQQAPIFIIYAGQQLPKNTTSHVNGKMLLQNGQILNEATFQHAGQAFQVVGGNGLPSQAQVLFPAPQTNGIIQQQKREFPSRHFPAMINGQTVAPPTLININGTTALLQQNGHPTTIFPPQSAVSIAPSISPSHIPQKRHGIPKQAIPISINHRMLCESKMTPPPLVQVKEEDIADNCIMSGGHVTPLSISTSSSATQISPKMVLPFSLLPDSLRGPPPTHPSLPYILVNEKQAGDSPRHIFVKPPSVASSGNSTMPPVSMPIYRFSTLNNVQPLQILTSVPSRDSCITLPDFMKQDTTIAH